MAVPTAIAVDEQFPTSLASVGRGHRSASDPPFIPRGQCLVGTQVPGGRGFDALETLSVAFSMQEGQHYAVRSPTPNAFLPLVGAMAQFPHGPTICDGSYVYSDLVGYQTSDITLLWTITPNPPPSTPTPFLTPPPPPCQTSPPPLRVPPNIRLVPLSPHP